MKKIIRSSWDEDEWTLIGDDIESPDVRQDMADNGEIDLWELAFMEGWDAAQ